MLTHNLSCKADCFIRIQCTIGIYIQCQFVKICNLTNTSILDVDIYALNRSKDRINRNYVDCHLFFLVFIRTYISTTVYYCHFNIKFAVCSTVQCSNDLIFVDDLKIRVTFDVRCSDNTLAISINVHGFCLIEVIAVILNCKTLNVHYNLSNVFFDTRDRTKFMNNAIDFNVTYCCTWQR